MTAYSRALALADLQAVYDQLPTVHCKGRCADSCTVVDGTELERALIADRGRALPPRISHERHLKLIDAGEHQRCPALGPVGNCTVYDVRPLICRGFGTWRTSACEHGCMADRFIEQREFAELMLQAQAVSDRWERAGRP